LFIFLEGRGEEGNKISHRLTFCFPPNSRDLEGRESKICYYHFNYIDKIIPYFVLKSKTILIKILTIYYLSLFSFFAASYLFLLFMLNHYSSYIFYLLWVFFFLLRGINGFFFVSFFISIFIYFVFLLQRIFFVNKLQPIYILFVITLHLTMFCLYYIFFLVFFSFWNIIYYYFLLYFISNSMYKRYCILFATVAIYANNYH
jgi:hypothetical protein